MAKTIQINYRNGSQWGIRYEAIAHIRATYYADVDPDTTYEEEFDFAMRDNYAAYDWFRNKMTGEQLRAHMFQIVPPKDFDWVKEMDDESTEYETNKEVS